MTSSELSDSPDPLRDLLQHAAPSRFDAGFDDRVLARLAATPGLQLVSNEDTLITTGRRWLPWLAAAAVLLAVVDRRESRANTIADISASTSVITTASSEVGTMAIPDWSAYQ